MFGGIWDEWTDIGKSIISCAIITTTPNDLLATIHDRMPAILLPEAQDRWLSTSAETSELKKLLIPYPSNAMKSHAVSKLVNYAQVEDREMIKPVDTNQEKENLMLF